VVRGRKYALAVIDEAPLVADLQSAWQNAIRPCLADLKGSAWFLGTPRGFNHFKTLFDRGQDSASPDWASWQMPTSANPFIDPAEIEAARADMTETAYGQEFLAQFVDAADGVFRFVLDAVRTSGPVNRQPRHEYVFGVDWGRSNDFTAICILDATTHDVVEIDRFTKVDYVTQQMRLKALYEKWQPSSVIAESNAMGTPIIEQLARDGIRVRPFNTTQATKAVAIEGLALAFERRDIRIPNDPILINELLAYSATPSANGLMRYSAPAGGHDDTVMSLVIAWSVITGAMQQRPPRAFWL